MSDHAMTGFDPKWESPVDYIIGMTRGIWEERGIADLDHLYAADIPVRFPGGSTVGNQVVIDATWATLSEFPDRQLLAEDVIWSDDSQGGFLSSHRIISTATHLGAGAFGEPTAKKLVFRTIADCAARDNAIYDEWLVRDVGAMVRQLGHAPSAFASAQIASEGGLDLATRPLTPDTSPAAIYLGTGNDHSAGVRYAEMLATIASGDSSAVEAGWDRAAQLDLPGGVTAFGWDAVTAFWGSSDFRWVEGRE